MNDFCDECGVSMDLHDMSLEDPCEDAEEQATAIERMERLMFGDFLR